MRFLSILITLALIGGLLYWYLKGGVAIPNGESTTRVAPQQAIKQAEDSTKLLQQSLQQQQQQIEQVK